MAETAPAPSDFRLDPHNECLLRGAQEVPLRPKTYAVLQHLVSHPGQLVTKSQLLDSVWTDSYGTDMVLKVSIHELRKVLEDDPRNPRYIQTLHGRGYRFIGRLDAVEPPPRGRLDEP